VGGSGLAHTELQRSVLPLVLFATVVFAATGYGYSSSPPPAETVTAAPSAVVGTLISSSNEGHLIGKIFSVRKVLANRYFVSRYPQIHYYLLYFAVRTSDQTYCAEDETPGLDEIDDLFSAKDTNSA
jgi:hypothetical protein